MRDIRNCNVKQLMTNLGHLRGTQEASYVLRAIVKCERFDDAFGKLGKALLVLNSRSDKEGLPKFLYSFVDNDEAIWKLGEQFYDYLWELMAMQVIDTYTAA